MTPVKELVREALERLSDDEANEILRYVREIEDRRSAAATLRRLAQSPSLSVPLSDPPTFESFEPILATGRPASEILIEDRR